MLYTRISPRSITQITG